MYCEFLCTALQTGVGFMCVYIERELNQARVIAEKLRSAGISQALDCFGESQDIHAAGSIVRARPAFGKNPNARLPGMLWSQNRQLDIHDPIWWFDIDDNGKFGDRASYNARNLHYPLWRDAVNRGRAVYLATAIGEKSSTGQQYRMVANEPFFLGGLMKQVGNDYAGTIITRDPHERFSRYHHKAFPLFIPIDRVQDWLFSDDDQVIKDILDHPTLPVDFEVTPVKSYVSAQPVGPSEILSAD